MTQTHQNFRDFCEAIEGPKVAFYRKVRDKIGVCPPTVDRWAKGDSKTSNPKFLAGLSELTNIPEDDLFKRH